jgi:hypothetical protein
MQVGGLLLCLDPTAFRPQQTTDADERGTLSDAG